jgi:LysR family transcriptional activator of dmlA
MESRVGLSFVNRTTRRMSPWALDGHGILMRAEWDIERYLKNGRLVQVLPQFHTPDADIYAVYPQRHQLAARVRALVDFAALSLNQGNATLRGPG